MSTEPGDGGYARTHLSMSDGRRAVKGSPTRDKFKQLHKSRLPSYMFACDIDLRWIEKNPYGVVAELDLKVGPRDAVTFSEVIGYNDDLSLGRKVFIIHAADEEALEAYRFTVREYLGGDPGPNPVIVRYGEEFLIDGFAEFARWQAAEREAWKARQRGGKIKEGTRRVF